MRSSTRDNRETGPRYHVTSRVGDRVVAWKQPLPDPFVRHDVHIGWRDLARGLIRRRLTVTVLIGGDPGIVNDVLRLDAGTAVYEPAPGCPHCPDGHTPPDHGQPWGARIGPERDGDCRPTTIHVARSAGAHVAESDVQWVRERLNRCP